ncbi:MAG: HAD family hydrolase [Oceanospirillales bacterium]|nr:HAD family hydrolase [Oceanospirillales bacterium]
MKVAFLDRDGVLNKEVHYLHRIADFSYTYRCVDALRNLIKAGYQIIVVTNQSGIARGYYSEADYQQLTDWYRQDLYNQGIELLDIVHCPHYHNGKDQHLSVNCQCRKPKPGMILEMAAKHSIPLEQAIMVGDKASDMEAARQAGIEEVYLVESGHTLDKELYTRYPVFRDLYQLSQNLIKR